MIIQNPISVITDLKKTNLLWPLRINVSTNRYLIFEKVVQNQYFLVQNNRNGLTKSIQNHIKIQLSIQRMFRILASKYYQHTSNLELLYQMSKKAKTPFFTLESHNIQIIEDPLDFYLSIYKGIKNASFRIGLSSLYLGTGSLERFLLKKISKKCQQTPDLQTLMLYDYNRSFRKQNGQSSVQMMKNEILDNFPENIKVSLNRQSSTNNVLGEIAGVHHQKIYIFDNSVILGGANLSHNYFLNRKDRYIHFKQCMEFSDYLFDYLRVMTENCYQIKEKVSLSPQQNLKNHYKIWKFSHRPEQYKDTFFEQQKQLQNIKNERQKEQQRGTSIPSKKIPKTRNLILSEMIGSDLKVYDEVTAQQRMERREKARQELFGVGNEDFVGNALMDIENIHEEGKQITQRGQKVYIFPFIQDPKMKESFQKEVFENVLTNSIKEKFPIKISSGYLNFPNEIIDILSKSEEPVEVLCSSPEANSFFRAGTFKKYIPFFYRCFQGFLMEKHPGKFKIRQFFNGKWSFHAKGIWIKENQNTYLSAVGSSNFNRRSNERDSQLQAYLVSTCPQFNNRLEKQWHEAQKNCKQITLEEIKKDEEIKYNVVSKFFSRIFSKFL